MRFARHRQRPGRRLASLGLLLLAATACSTGDDARAGTTDRGSKTRTSTAGEAPAVRSGAAVLLSDSIHLVRGRRVGLITNQTGVVAADPAADDAEPESTIDLLWRHPAVEVAALFGPEHSIRGRAEAGDIVSDGVDPRTGAPIYSLYGTTRKPTPEMLEGVEVLLFDIQDVGARYYTYVSTMALAMEAAGEAGIPFVVLDRPNPVGGVAVQGNVLDPDFSSFVGPYPVPMRHGMTPGELARLFRAEFGVRADLRVVPARGWRRSMSFQETGLPWIAPSPNMPSLRSALHYPGTCLFEGTNLSVGRGTDRPFQQVGAPWLDAGELVRRLAAHGLDDVSFEAVRFTPEAPGDGKYGGVEVSGVRFAATGPAYDPTRAAVAVLVEARRLAGSAWEWRASHFDRLAGTDRLRLGVEAGEDPDALTARWPRQLERFRELRGPYLIYPR